MSALRIGIVRASLEFDPNAVVAFDRKLEVSLDCHVCRRRCRTVIFRPGEAHGVCTPTKHAFSGRILNVDSRVEGNAHIAVYLLRLRRAFAARYAEQHRATAAMRVQVRPPALLRDG